MRIDDSILNKEDFDFIPPGRLKRGIQKLMKKKL
jgi:hypothetical protein